MSRKIFLFFLIILAKCLVGQDEVSLLPLKLEALSKINSLRKNGCKCGRRFFKPVDTLAWHETLYKSAFDYAMHLDRGRFFGHTSLDGLNVGRRVDLFNYDWQWIGENLGKGQKDIDQLLKDWIRSYTHCTLLMDAKMKEMGLAKYNSIWVLHLGTRQSKLPSN